MAKEYIEREAALGAVADVQYMMYADEGHEDEYAAVNVVFRTLATVPTSDVVEVEAVKSWLYEIAFNNTGTISDVCGELAERMDGLRNFAKNRAASEEDANDVQ